MISPKNNIELAIVYSSDLEKSTPQLTTPKALANDADIAIAGKYIHSRNHSQQPANKSIKSQQHQKVNNELLKNANKKVLKKQLAPMTVISDKNKNINNGQSEYIANIISLVSPDYIPSDINLKTTMVVKISINKDMVIKSIKVIKYSDNDIYNQNILDKLKSIDHFPKLPAQAHFKDYQNLVFTFSPKQSG